MSRLAEYVRSSWQLGLPAVIFGFYYAKIVVIGGTVSGYPSLHGMTFNSMALHLLEGRFDVDPAVIGDEAYVRNGRTYAYFGVLPALLRLPLSPFLDLRSQPLEPHFMAAAMLIGAAAQAAAGLVALRAADDGRSRLCLRICVLIWAFASGPPVMIGAKVAIFSEAVLWAWALSMCFIAVALPGIVDARRFGAGRLTLLAVLAGLCVNTRPSTGIGLLLALAALLLVLAAAPPSCTGASVPTFIRRALSIRFLLPAAAAIAFVVAAGVVNFGRWGDPFLFADLRDQLQASRYPDRIARLDRHGLFDPTRIWLGVVYYFFPVWILAHGGHAMLSDSIRDSVDGFELPASTFFLSAPLTILLAAVGVVALARRALSIWRGPLFAILAGVAVPALMMLTAWYMAFRYRAEFSPAFILLACVGIIHAVRMMQGVSIRAQRMAMALLLSVLAMQVLSAHLHGALHALSVFGPYHGPRP